MMETDSLSRRNAATSRLLERKAVVPNLVDYFCTDTPVEYKDATANIDIDSIREKYGLNRSQAAAFEDLWSKRPLGLLQGPPGTGKTKFIAALVHYALSNGNIRNVLLSSQSHEAVNNATESVLKLFRNEGIEPSLVRIGQEGNVSELLKPFHSAKVEEHYREQFRAGLKQRFRVAGRHIGLPIDFTDDLYFLESTLRPVLANLHALAGVDAGSMEDSKRRHRVSSLKRTVLDLAETAGIPTLRADDWMDSNAYDRAINAIASKNNIDSPELVRRMRGVATLASDWMGSVTSRRRSFEEFLAKTRQIVAGTCVGLGRSSLGLTSARFDLVVVDEAARCTSSELAVPLQAGRWVLLVGDHCQLEPFHQPVVIRETQQRLNIPTKDVIRSDFERAFASVHGRRYGQTLLTQYRMLPAIGKLISDAFYDGRLDHGREQQIIPDEVCPDFLQKQLVWVRTDSLDEHAFQIRQRTTGTSLANQVEANAIVDILRRLDDHQPFVDWLARYDDDRKPIGIICTYAAQRELVRQKLRSVGLSGTILKSYKIDTVDSYQGKENPLVILSLVRNNADGHLESGKRTIAQGFMAKANRVNVGLSRAMDKLIIVGASQRWPSDSPMARVASLFERLNQENQAELVVPSKIESLPRGAKGTRQRTPLKESAIDEGER